MKMNKILLLLVLFAILVNSGCQPAAPSGRPAAASAQAAALSYSLAQVSSLQINTLSAGDQKASVTVRGQLPDGCTRLDRTVVERVTGGFILTVSAARPIQATACPPEPAPFEHLVTLDLAGLPGGAYTVIANGVRETFILPVAPSAADLLTPTSPASVQVTVLPSPEQTQAPSVEVTVVPTNTPQATATPFLPAATSTPVKTAAPSPQATETVSATTSTTGQAGCEDKANFQEDITIPDGMVIDQGQSFVKSWRLYNAGTCTWGPGYELVFAYGELMQAAPPIPLPVTRPGQTVEISAKLTAPNTPGQYVGNWKLKTPAGQVFGVGIKNDPIWVQIQVGYIPPDGQTTVSTPLPTAIIPATGGQSCTYARNPEFESQILAQINQIRATFNLKPLVNNARLAAAALWYSVDMACHNRTDPVKHTDSTGGRWYERISAQGYAYSDASEIVWFGPPAYGGTPQAAINWWMLSPIHHAIILDPKLTEAGVGYAVIDPTDNGYYTVDFAIPGE